MTQASSYVLDVATERPYRVHIGTFLLERAGALIREACGGARALIVTDSNVGPLYGPVVSEKLQEAGYRAHTFTFEAGEARKCAATYLDILECMAQREFTRSDVVVALGGGVTGDLAGFAAATYMRGCRFAQLPTSLLAMVDSSVGGKTAVDLAAGKNLAGAFWQPDVVIADVGCLATLSPEQFADGCGEVVKHAMIADAELFGELERTPLTFDLLQRDVARVAYLVARNIDIKRAVVEADEREGGMRKILNFGHSIGHAVEAAEGYRRGHGSCVSIGMCLIASAAVRDRLCAAEDAERLRALLAAHGLPTTTERPSGELFACALHDKKRDADAIDLVVPRGIGRVSLARTPLDEFFRLIVYALDAQHAEGAPKGADPC